MERSMFYNHLGTLLATRKSKIYGDEFFSPRQKELFPGMKRELILEQEDVSTSSDPFESCMERKGYTLTKIRQIMDSIAEKLTPDMFGKTEKLTGAEAMFQEQVDKCQEKRLFGIGQARDFSSWERSFMRQLQDRVIENAERLYRNRAGKFDTEQGLDQLTPDDTIHVKFKDLRQYIYPDYVIHLLKFLERNDPRTYKALKLQHERLLDQKAIEEEKQFVIEQAKRRLEPKEKKLTPKPSYYSPPKSRIRESEKPEPEQLRLFGKLPKEYDYLQASTLCCGRLDDWMRTQLHLDPSLASVSLLWFKNHLRQRIAEFHKKQKQSVEYWRRTKYSPYEPNDYHWLAIQDQKLLDSIPTSKAWLNKTIYEIFQIAKDRPTKPQESKQLTLFGRQKAFCTMLAGTIGTKNVL